MTVKLNLAAEINPTGWAVCDNLACGKRFLYTGGIKKEGHPLTDPDRRIDGGGPLPLKCPWCFQGTMRYQK
jgi:hypothetical protein